MNDWCRLKGTYLEDWREWETFEMLEVASSEHARTLLSMRALFCACVQPVKAVEKDCPKVSHCSKLVPMLNFPCTSCKHLG